MLCEMGPFLLVKFYILLFSLKKVVIVQVMNQTPWNSALWEDGYPPEHQA